MQIKMKLNGGGWGGLRLNAGRKRIHSKGVAHTLREKVTGRTPLHINFRYRSHIRNKDTLKLLKRAIKNARSHDLKILHYSFQSNHVHLIIEAPNNDILTRGMRSLTITLAKGLNRGRIQIERYHLHVLRSLRETKHAVRYVLFNRHHHEKGTYTQVDDYTSILALREGLRILRKFAKERKITIKVDGGNFWRPDHPKSFLSKRAINQLCAP